mmetsp:Transcript_30338/g.46410  ORF Transcript_30338/g.46410 Transcript_30338/m.46410 type:complete len:263 (+) Transcript_30338:4311-5099(+)
MARKKIGIQTEEEGESLPPASKVRKNILLNLESPTDPPEERNEGVAPAIIVPDLKPSEEAAPKGRPGLVMIDTEKINEEYDFGGEQGKRNYGRSNDVNGLEDFESGLLELANMCLASMKRESPEDPILYDSSTRETFEDPFGDEDRNRHPNFNRPQTMRGVRQLVWGEQRNKTHHTQAIEEEISERDEVFEEPSQSEGGGPELVVPQKKNIILYQDEEEANGVEPPRSGFQGLVSNSQRSDFGGTMNNSKLENQGSYEDISD